MFSLLSKAPKHYDESSSDSEEELNVDGPGDIFFNFPRGQRRDRNGNLIPEQIQMTDEMNKGLIRLSKTKSVLDIREKRRIIAKLSEWINFEWIINFWRDTRIIDGNIIEISAENATDDEIALIWDALRHKEVLGSDEFNEFDGEIPKEVEHMKRLSVLVIDGSNITELPDELIRCPLTSLTIKDTSIEELPLLLLKMPYLKTLILRNNSKMNGLPSWIDELKITNFTISGKNFIGLPRYMGGMVGLEELTIMHTKIREFPVSITELGQLKKLKISTNKIKTIPKQISKLKNLIRLEIEEKRITTIPSKLWNLFNLKELWFKGTQITEVSEDIVNLSKLEYIDFSESPNLTSLPNGLGELKLLEAVIVNDCPKLHEFPQSMMDLKRLNRVWFKGSGIVSLPNGMFDYVEDVYPELRSEVLD